MTDSITAASRPRSAARKTAQQHLDGTLAGECISKLLSADDADVKGANEDPRTHSWTPKPSPVGAGHNSILMEMFCAEFAQLAVELEKGWV